MSSIDHVHQPGQVECSRCDQLPDPPIGINPLAPDVISGPDDPRYKRGCIYKHPHPPECRNQEDMAEPNDT
jgi:hypothetical protein